MELIIKGNSKEIASLVVELQNQHGFTIVGPTPEVHTETIHVNPPIQPFDCACEVKNTHIRSESYA